MNIQLFPIGLLIPDTRYWIHPGKRQPTKDYVRNYKLFMQNEPNFQKSQMNVNSFITKDYENKHDWTLGENEPKTNPIYEMPKMNVSSSIRKDYENICLYKRGKNKPKTNPIQTQFAGRPK